MSAQGCSRANLPDPLYESESTEIQRDTEIECEPYFIDLTTLGHDELVRLRETGLLSDSGLDIQLLREKHAQYLSQVWVKSLGAPFVSLDASRPWILYWCLHGSDLLGEVPSDEDRCRMVETLEHCWGSYSTSQHPVSKEEDPFYFIGTDEPGNVTLLVGGFGGGPSQMPHAATTFASVCSLCILVTCGGKAAGMAKDLMERIRMPLYRWMATLLTPASGAYRMHTDGEVDVRATYTIISCAKLLGIASPFLCQESVADFVRSCQTFEGGLGGEPWSEAHGGYTYCGVAALHIIGKLEVLDIPALTGWVARRQMVFEGGFSGRSNKLVDGCYSFWQGAAMTIASSIYRLEDGTEGPTLFDEEMLERYILLCAQDIKGGLRDKPSKSRDFYHSCYNLSGLSIAQRGCNRVARTDPCFNIRVERAQEVLAMTWS